MAGDWIPMRIDLHEDPAVMQIAEDLQVREEVVVGYLHKVWSWMSRQMRDSRATHVTLLSLGRVTNLPGFPEAMRDAGWLIEGVEDGVPYIEVPNFDRWLGESAKKRLKNTKRQSDLRKSCRADVAQVSRPLRDKSATREEKRREENKILYTRQFQEFWEAYPMRNGRRVGKKKAAQQWKKIPESERDAVMEGVANYAAESNGFAKDAGRFLRDRLWEDYTGKPKPRSRVASDETLANWTPE